MPTPGTTEIEQARELARLVSEAEADQDPYEGFRYSDGVVAALDWVLGRISVPPVVMADIPEELE